MAQRQPGPIVISPIVLLEATNAFELRIFRGQATRLNITKAMADFEADMKNGVLHVRQCPASVWDAARTLSRKYTAKAGNRSLDILHVAAAMALKADAFLTFDRARPLSPKPSAWLCRPDKYHRKSGTRTGWTTMLTA